MIDAISISNYKCFCNLSLHFSNLNVFTGLNGSGKSSLMQLLDFALSMKAKNKEVSFDDVKISSFSELVNISSSENNVHIECTFGDKISNISFSHIAKTKAILVDVDGGAWVGSHEFIGASRMTPEWLYSQSTSEHRRLGKDGMNSIHYYETFGKERSNFSDFYSYFGGSETGDGSISGQVLCFMRFISPGISFYGKELSDLNKITLKYKYDNMDIQLNPFNVGYGITNGLPVVIALLKSQPGEIVMLENPENNIHPSGQRKLGELIGYVASKGVQVFVETHSDHVLNGIRIAVKRSVLSEELLRIFYFSRGNGSSSVEQIRVHKSGAFSKTPKGFLDEWELSIDELLS